MGSSPLDRQQVCAYCGAEFGGRKRRFCYDCLGVHAEDPERYNRQYRAMLSELARRSATPKVCPVCKQEYRRGGNRCQPCERAHRQRCRRCGVIYEGANRFYCSDECRFQTTCVDCGVSFLRHGGYNAKNPRCDACRRVRSLAMRRAGGRRRRQRGRQGIRGPYHDLEIFDRDGWRCQLCRRLVRPWHRVPNPLAPTIDHIVPEGLGGADTAENVQTACFECNCRKNMHGTGDQLRLIG